MLISTFRPDQLSLCSREDASRLLEHLYSSPNQEFHTRIVRRRNLLSVENPRPTSAGLLLALLCMCHVSASPSSNAHINISTGVSCYMPTATGTSILPNLNHGQFTCLRRKILSQVVQLMRPVLLAEVEPTFDDAITISLLVTIGICEDETYSYFPQWLAFFKFLVRKMNLCIEPDEFDEESKEERRRYDENPAHF